MAMKSIVVAFFIVMAAVAAEDVCEAGSECAGEIAASSMIQVQGAKSKRTTAKRHASKGACEECVHSNCKHEIERCADDEECDDYHACAHLAEQECTEECGGAAPREGTCRRRYTC